VFGEQAAGESAGTPGWLRFALHEGKLHCSSQLGCGQNVGLMQSQRHTGGPQLMLQSLQGAGWHLVSHRGQSSL